MLPEIDTIGLNYRAGGVGLDSVDAVNVGKINLRPAGGFGETYEYNLPENLFQSPGGISYRTTDMKVKPLYIGLPYLGFQYAFGSALNQALNLEYHQFYDENTHLHFRYHRRTSNGLLRNGDFKLNDLSLLFFHSSGKWSTKLDAYYGAYNYAENSGITTDTLIEEFDIEFTPVIRENARSEVRKLDALWENYYQVLSISERKAGLKSRHNYTLTGRVYTENPLNQDLVENIYIDSFSTRDQYQTASISNGLGIYLAGSNVAWDVTLNHRYWRNQNLGLNRDTIEAFVHSNFHLKWNKVILKNEFYANFLGALGEMYNHASLGIKPVRKMDVQLAFRFDNRLPLPYQRFHEANNIRWDLSSLELQQILNFSGSIRYGATNYIRASVNWTSVNNGLYFINNDWRQDTLDLVSAGKLSLGAAYHLGSWSFYPGVSVGFNTDNFSYQPLFSTLNRIAYKTKLFKARRLGFTIGLDAGYSLGYQFMHYNTLLSVMEPVQTQTDAPDLVKLNVFTALKIEEFRFFIRGENLDYFINDQTSRIDLNYPIMPFIVRIGVTWDFFN